MRSRTFPPLAALLVFVGIMAALFYVDHAEQARFRDKSRLAVLDRLNITRNQLETSLYARLFLTRALAAYVGQHPSISEEEFLKFAQSLSDTRAGGLVLQLAQRMKISHMYPPATGTRRTGFSLLDDPQRASVLRKSISTRRFILAGPFPADDGSSVLYGCEPIFVPSGDGDSTGERLWGLAIAEMDMGTLLRSAGLSGPRGDLVYSMRGKDGLGPKGDIFFGDQTLFLSPFEPVIAPVSVPNGSWQLAAAPAEGWPALAPTAWHFRLGGGALALVASILTFSFAREPARLREAVANATHDLRESEQRFRSLFEASFEAVIVHREGVVLDVNPAFEGMFGYRGEEALGMPVLHLVDEAVRSESERRVNEGDERPYESLAVRKDGSRFDIEVTGKQHLYRGMQARVAAIRDISLQKKAQNALRYRLDFERVVASISTHFINLEPSKAHAGMVEALAQLGEFARSDRCFVFFATGPETDLRLHAEWTADGVAPMGAAARLYTSVADYPWFGEKLRRCEPVRVGRPEELPAGAAAESRLHLAEGVRSSVSVPMVSGGAPMGVIGLHSLREAEPWPEDVASLLRIAGEILANALERSRAEEQLRHSYAQLDEASRQLQDYALNLEARVRDRTLELDEQKDKALEASRLKSEFLSVISHELRTPLNSILGLAQLVLMKTQDDLPRQQRENLRAIVSSGKRLLGLINQLLDLSKIEAGKVEVSLSTFTTDLILAEASQAIKPLAEAKGLEYRTRNEAPGAYTHGDSPKIVQILLNLLANAVKFTDAGHVELAVSGQQGGYAFVVSDSGIGLSTEEVDIVFERFRQADSSLTRRYGGTGLGLTISRHLAQLLGGRLTVESRKGEGSAFSLWVPRVYHMGTGVSEELRAIAAVGTPAP